MSLKHMECWNKSSLVAITQVSSANVTRVVLLKWEMSTVCKLYKVDTNMLPCETLNLYSGYKTVHHYNVPKRND